MGKKEKPRGREKVIDALIEAAADLWSKKGIEAVSVREIALHAGVNHGLVHIYFGSKENLVRQTMDRLVSTFRADAGEPDSFLDALVRGSYSMQKNEKYWRLLSRALIDGKMDEDKIQSDFKYMNNIVRLIDEEKKKGEIKSDMDSRFIATGILSMGFGMLIFKKLLFAATGLNTENQDTVTAELFKGWISLIKELPSDTGLETMPELSFKSDT